MKRFKLLLTVALLVGSASILAYSQDTITPEDAAKFIGQQKTVCGTVASANYDAKSKCTLLNIIAGKRAHSFSR